MFRWEMSGRDVQVGDVLGEMSSGDLRGGYVQVGDVWERCLEGNILKPFEPNMYPLYERNE